MPPPLFLLFSAVLMIARTSTCDTSLSPATWPPGEFERLEKMTLNRFERPKPLAVSAGKGLVAGTTEPLAVHFWNGRTQERRERHGCMFSDCPYRYENKCNGRTILMQALMLARDQATVGCQGGRGKENFCVRATRKWLFLAS